MQSSLLRSAKSIGIASSKILVFLTIFSGCQQSDVGLPELESGVHNLFAFLGGAVIVGTSYAIDESMSAE